MKWIDNLADWFDRQSTTIQAIITVTVGLLGLGMLWAFVFAGADFSGFGDFIKSLFGG